MWRRYFYTAICGPVLTVGQNRNTLLWRIPFHRLAGLLSKSGALSGFDFQRMFKTAGYEMNWIDVCIRFRYVRHVSLETTGLSLVNVRAAKVL